MEAEQIFIAKPEKTRGGQKMEPKQALAHISEDGQRTQTVAAHLDGTARRSASFAAAFGAEQDGYYTGTLHDIGKYSAAFQRRSDFIRNACIYVVARQRRAENRFLRNSGSCKKVNKHIRNTFIS